MKIRLEKKNRVTTDYVEIMVNEHILNVQQGKVKKAGGPKWTRHCGTNENAIKEANKLKQEFIDKKYIEVNSKLRSKEFNGVYDKAKWHFSGDFPEGVDFFQGYVHTGFYLAWIINKGLFNTNGDKHLDSETSKVKKRKLTGAQFFKENLDGVLMDEDLTDSGNEFTYKYYEKGAFLKDYSKALGTNLPTLYHVEDNWENYEKLRPILDDRFKLYNLKKIEKVQS